MDDDYSKMLRAMDDLVRPYRSTQDAIERLMKPQLELQDRVSRLLEPYGHVRSILDAMESPAQKLREEFERGLGSQQYIRSQQEEFLDAKYQLQKQFEDLLRPQRWVDDKFHEVISPQAEFVASAWAYLKPSELAREQIQKLLNPLNQYLSELHDFAIDIDAAGNLLIDGEQIPAAEISAAAKTFDGAQESARTFLQDLVIWLGQLTPPLRQVFLFLVLPYVISIFANLTTPIYQEWWVEHVATEPRVAKKEIMFQAHEFYDENDLVDYRFVYATRLHVHAEERMRSEIIDSLYLGKSVRVIRRKKAWTEIEYLDESTRMVCRGWVYSRYLHKFGR